MACHFKNKNKNLFHWATGASILQPKHKNSKRLNMEMGLGASVDYSKEPLPSK